MADPAPEHPPGTSNDPGLGALPVTYGELFGRGADLDHAAGQVTDGGRPVLTVTGPGGVGKTRLAVALGERLSSHFGDGVRFVALAGERTVEEGEARVRQAIGLGAGGADDQVRGWLESRETLLLLDNLEQIEGAGKLVAGIVPRRGSSRIVVTSRGPLHIAAEQVVRLEPLAAGPTGGEAGRDLAPAVALFVEVATAADSAYWPNAGELEEIGELCRRLDGLPLAIRLAAQRRRLLGVPEMLRRVDIDGSLLVGSGPDVEERQRTVERSIAWSLDLLTEAERVDANLLSLAPAGWSDATLADVEPAVTVETLGRLIDLGIVGRDGDRLAMLQTVQDVVSGDGPAERRRENEGRFVAAWLLGASRVGAVGATAAALIDDPNLRLVVRLLERSEQWETLLRFVGALDRYWTQSGTAVAIVGSLREALVHAELPDAKEQRIVLALASLASGLAGEPAEGIRWASRLVEIVEPVGTAQERLWARNLAGGAQAFAGNYEEAYRIHEESLALEREGADISKVLVNLAGAAVSLGRNDEAVAFLRRSAASVVDSHPAPQMHLAELATRSGDHAAARGYLVSAVRGAVERNERLWQMGAAVVVSGTALAAGDLEAAAMLLARVERLMERERIGLRVLMDDREVARMEEVRGRVGPERWRVLREIDPEAGLPGLMAATLAWLERERPPREGRLTPREDEIAAMIAAGRSNQEIADALFLSRRTVQTHVANMLRKLELPSRSALAAWQATASSAET